MYYICYGGWQQLVNNSIMQVNVVKTQLKCPYFIGNWRNLPKLVVNDDKS